MIVVTGGAGFIGSNLIKGLNSRGITDILVVDNLESGKKCLNLSGLDFTDFVDKDQFLSQVQNNRLKNIKAIFHQGACSSTTMWDGKYLMKNNYEYSKDLFNFCSSNKISFIYASSASVYGNIEIFEEERKFESPINMYAFSKFQFDQYLRSLGHFSSQVVGLRYFNVYGPGEFHKDSMASVMYHFNNQLLDTGVIRLFEGEGGIKNGEQKRDFIYVDDIIKMILWFFDNKSISGIFNAGTGRAQTYNEVANAIITYYSRGVIEYVPFPRHLIGAYQNYTQANMSKLRSCGYKEEFLEVSEGVKLYLDFLNKRQ
jgi:ADP-L-glycero-D-manno-heptose 6-epimerase